MMLDAPIDTTQTTEIRQRPGGFVAGAVLCGLCAVISWGFFGPMLSAQYALSDLVLAVVVLGLTFGVLVAGNVLLLDGLQYNTSHVTNGALPDVPTAPTQLYIYDCEMCPILATSWSAEL